MFCEWDILFALNIKKAQRLASQTYGEWVNFVIRLENKNEH